MRLTHAIIAVTLALVLAASGQAPHGEPAGRLHSYPALFSRNFVAIGGETLPGAMVDISASYCGGLAQVVQAEADERGQYAAYWTLPALLSPTCHDATITETLLGIPGPTGATVIITSNYVF